MQIPADTLLRAPAIPNSSSSGAPNCTILAPQTASAAPSVPGEFLYTFRLWGQQTATSSANNSNPEALAQPLETYQFPVADNLSGSLPPFHPWISNDLVSRTVLPGGTSTTDAVYSAMPTGEASVEGPSAEISYLADPSTLHPMMEDQAWPYQAQNGQQQSQWLPFQPMIGTENAMLPHGPLAADYTIAPHLMLDYSLVQPLGANDQSILSSTPLPMSPLPPPPPPMQGMAQGHLSSLPAVLAADPGSRSLATPVSSFMPTPEPQFLQGMGMDPTASFSAAQQLLQRPRRGCSTQSLMSDAAFLLFQPMSTAYPSIPYDTQPSSGLPEVPVPPLDLYPATTSAMPSSTAATAATAAAAHQHKPRVQSLPNVPTSTTTDAVPAGNETEKVPETKDQLPNNRQTEPLRWYQLQLFRQLQPTTPSTKPEPAAEEPQEGSGSGNGPGNGGRTPGPAASSPRVLSRGKQQHQKPRTKSADSGKQGSGNPSPSQKWPLGRPKKRRSLDLEAESAMRSATGVFPAAARSTMLEPVFIAFDPQSLSPTRSPKSTSAAMPASTAQTSHSISQSLNAEAGRTEKTDKKTVRPRKRSKVGEGASKAEQLVSSPAESLPTSPLAAIPMVNSISPWSTPQANMASQPERLRPRMKRDIKVTKSFVKKNQLQMRA